MVGCDVRSTPSSVSFQFLGPDPRRILDANLTGPTTKTWQSDIDLATLVPATLTLKELTSGPYTSANNGVTVSAQVSYGPASFDDELKFRTSVEGACNGCMPVDRYPGGNGVVQHTCGIAASVQGNFNITVTTPNPAGGEDLSASG